MQVYNAFYVDKPFIYNHLRTMLLRFLQVEVSGSFSLPSYSNSVSLASAIPRCFPSSRWNASACEDLGEASRLKGECGGEGGGWRSCRFRRLPIKMAQPWR